MSDFYDVAPAEQAERMAAVAARALGAWGLDGARLNLIKYRENAVFEVQVDGERRALRIHRPGYHSDDALRSELQWMRALSEAGIAVPEIVPTAAGELFASGEFPGVPARLQIDMFDWIDGQQVGTVEGGVGAADIEATYRTIGSLAGRLHNQAAGWQPPEGFTRHAWCEHGLMGEQPFWGRFWELPALTADQRGLLVRARERVFQDLSKLDKSPAQYSMIHADFAPENLMVEGDQIRLIDFDDSGFGWHLFELVTSLYFILGEDYFDAAQAALIEGYRSERALPDDQLALLPLFFLARGTTYVGWVHTRPETETAQEMTPWLVDAVCDLAENYLSD